MKVLKVLKMLSVILLAFAYPNLVVAQGSAEPGTVMNVVWSENGDKIAVVTFGEGMRIFDAITQQSIITMPVSVTGQLIGAAFNPDASKIATGGTDPISGSPVSYLWDVQTGQQLLLLQKDGGISTDIEWSKDGTEIALGGPGSTNVRNAITGEAILQVPSGEDTGRVAWNSNNILTILWASKLETWDMTTVQQIQRTRTTGIRYSVEWSLDNHHLLIGNTLISQEGRFHSLQIIDSTNAEIVQEFGGFPTYITSAHWDYDETHILSTALDGVVRITSIESGITTSILSSDQPIYSAMWSPYGGRIAVGIALDANSKLEGTAVSPLSGNSIPGLEIVVPAASLDLVQSITARCNQAKTSQTDTVTLLSTDNLASLTPDQIPDFVAQVKALPVDAIPPACAADLIAVAEAIIAAE